MTKLEKLENEYRTIKTKALGGVRISRKEAVKALVIKREIEKLKKGNNHE